MDARFELRLRPVTEEDQDMTIETDRQPIDPPAEPDPMAHVAESDSSSLFLRHGLSITDVLVCAIAGWLVIAFGPFFLAEDWTPRMLAVLAVVPAGLVSLGRRIARLDPASLAAASVLAWVALSGLLSSNPAMVLFGSIGRESSVVVLAGSFGLWSLSRDLSPAGRRLLLNVLLAMLSFSAVIGIAQILFELDQGSLAAIGGRASGLTTHPVYFGALMAAGVALVAARWDAMSRPAAVSLLTLFAVGAGISGSRIAVAAAMLALVVGLVRRSGWLRWLAAGAFVLGNAIALVLVRIGESNPATSAEGAAALDRITSTGSAMDARLNLWWYGLQAWAEQPIVGWGLGNFRSATQSKYTLEFTRVHAPSDRVPWFDAHNILVEWLVAVGVIGLLLFVAFWYLAARRCRGPLALAAGAIAITWLFEPTSLITLPLVMLLVGASGPVQSPAPMGRWGSRAIVVAVLVGAALGGALAASDLRLKHAADRLDADAAESAAAWFWRDPIASDIVAQVWFIVEQDRPEAEVKALDWSQRTVDFDPDRAGWWNSLAKRQFYFGDDPGAEASLRQAIVLQPWRPVTWRNALTFAIEVGDEDLQDKAEDVLCALQLPDCPQP